MNFIINRLSMPHHQFRTIDDRTNAQISIVFSVSITCLMMNVARFLCLLLFFVQFSCKFYCFFTRIYTRLAQFVVFVINIFVIYFRYCYFCFVLLMCVENSGPSERNPINVWEEHGSIHMSANKNKKEIY